MSISLVKFHAIGCWKPGDVLTERVADRRPRIAEVEHEIDRSWLNAMLRPGVNLFDGPMCRLEYFHAGEKLTLGLSDTSYKVFLGTNLAHSEWADRFGPAVLANPVGLSCALESVDGFLMFGRRNSSVAYYPDRVHPFAGALEPAGQMDVFADIRRELKEELGMSDSDVQDIACMGLVEDTSIRQPELVFAVKSSKSRSDISGNVDAREHRECVAIAGRPDKLSAALKDAALTPVAIATALLWGRARFGQAWFDQNQNPSIVC